MNRVEVYEQGQDRGGLHDRQKEKECELQCLQAIPGIIRALARVARQNFRQRPKSNKGNTLRVRDELMDEKVDLYLEVNMKGPL